MRLRVCAGLLALVLSGCTHIPDHVLVIVDGNRIELAKAPSATTAAEDEDDDGDEDE